MVAVLQGLELVGIGQVANGLEHGHPRGLARVVRQHLILPRGPQRGSFSARLTMVEKPWQGAPPQTASMSRLPMPARWRTCEPDKDTTLRQIATDAGKLW